MITDIAIMMTAILNTDIAIIIAISVIRQYHTEDTHIKGGHVIWQTQILATVW